MATVILVRHGRTTANASGTLAGRLPGVSLDDQGRLQVAHAAERLRGLPIAAFVTSPMSRCRQTASILAADSGARSRVDQRLTECDYGSWSGRPLKQLSRDRLWKTVQTQPSAVTFPDGESMADMQRRGVQCVREIDGRVESEHGEQAVWVAVSHGDVIKSIIADALGLHLDLFQRIAVDPASMTVIRYTTERPYVLSTNTTSGDLAWLAAPPPRRGQTRGAAVGGGAGPGSNG